MLDVRLNALKRAMQLEKEGMAFYQASRDKATSEIGRCMFEYLRKSEEGHIRRIREIYHTLEQSGVWPEHPPVAEESGESYNTIFTSALAELKEKQSLDADDIAALEQAAEEARELAGVTNEDLARKMGYYARHMAGRRTTGRGGDAGTLIGHVK